GTAVTHIQPVPSGGCSPANVVCNPTSGSNFPNGTTTVNCSATDSCNHTAGCTFNVTVNAPPPERYSTSNVLPPPDGMYVSPQLYHQLYANGIIISNISHRRFTQSEPPPPPGGPQQMHSFGSLVQMMVSMDHGKTFAPASAPAQVLVT